MQIIHLRLRDDGVTLVCKARFTYGSYKIVRSPRPGEDVAKNSPDNQYSCTTILSVLCEYNKGIHVYRIIIIFLWL